MGDMQWCPGVVEKGRNCAIILQPTPEKRLEDSCGCSDTAEVVKPDESWEG